MERRYRVESFAAATATAAAMVTVVTVVTAIAAMTLQVDKGDNASLEV